MELVFSQIFDASPLEYFYCGIEKMDEFIHGKLDLFIKGAYCKAFVVCSGNEIIGFFALNNDSLELEMQESYDLVYKDDINMPYAFIEEFLDMPYYPAVEISYLAVNEKYRKNGFGSLMLDEICRRASTQNFSGCMFITVEPIVEKNYSATGFYIKNDFKPVHKNVKRTRMYKVLDLNKQLFI